jgi:hypothetical protein
MCADTLAVRYAALVERTARAGLAVRGAFHPAAGEFAGLPGEGTLMLLGFTGGRQWPVFQAAPEARDGAPHPLDRWSRRVIDELAREYGARAHYPGDRPALPFQRLARRAEPTHPSPLGILIHPEFGLWHAYRGALHLPARVAFPQTPGAAPPCTRCGDQPCRSGCPVNAFRDATLDVGACLAHLDSPAGADCREHGCRARRACPAGTAYRYGPEQMRFHQAAFRAAVRAR